MSHLLRRAAFAAAATALSAVALRDPSEPLPFPGLFVGSSSPATYDAAQGHLGLARAHQGLRELNAMLTPEAFLLDATHALSAGALRHRPFYGERLRLLCDYAREEIAKESGSDTERAQALRLDLALVDAEDGRFEDALARLAAERPSDPRSRICAAVISYLVGLLEEGNQWLSGIREDVRQKNEIYLTRAVLAATLGGAPRAVAGFEGLVGFAAFQLIDLALWAKYLDGDISMFKKIVYSGLLWRVVANKYKDYCKGKLTGVQPEDHLEDTILRRFIGFSR